MTLINSTICVVGPAPERMVKHAADSKDGAELRKLFSQDLRMLFRKTKEVPSNMEEQQPPIEHYAPREDSGTRTTRMTGKLAPDMTWEKVLARLGSNVQRSREETRRDTFYDTAYRDLYARGVAVCVNDDSPEIRVGRIPVGVGDIDWTSYSLPLNRVDTDAVASRLASALDLTHMLSRGGHPENWQAIQERLLLEKAARVAMHRRVYRVDDLEVRLDDVRSLGGFVQVLCRDPAMIARASELISKLCIEEIPLSYFELMFRRLDYAKYVRGVRVLSGDPHEPIINSPVA